jgi:hypothetical protein
MMKLAMIIKNDVLDTWKNLLSMCIIIMPKNDGLVRLDRNSRLHHVVVFAR